MNQKYNDDIDDKVMKNDYNKDLEDFKDDMDND